MVSELPSLVLFIPGWRLPSRTKSTASVRHVTSVRVLESTFFRGKRIGEEEVEDSHDVTYGRCRVKELCTEDEGRSMIE